MALFRKQTVKGFVTEVTRKWPKACVAELMAFESSFVVKSFVTGNAFELSVSQMCLFMSFHYLPPREALIALFAREGLQPYVCPLMCF